MAGKRVTLLVGALFGSGAFGSESAVDYVYAPVVDVEPVIRWVTVERPRTECWQETVYQPHPANKPFRVAGPTIAGGLIGGVIGHQFGSGSGQDAMTLIGSVVGSALANERAVRNAYRHGVYQVRGQPVERCEVITERHQEERIEGYRVTYEYEGRHYTMRTQRPPGERVRLRVSVQPVGY